MDYVIIQAGGRGTRLLPWTKNRPKAMVPVDNLPLMFHLFRKYPEKKFVIIGDYQFDVLRRYLETYAKIRYILIHAHGAGNAAGIKEALSYIPDDSPFLLIWSDLLLPEDLDIDALPPGCYVGVTNHNKCSWRYLGQRFEKTDTEKNGLAGCFLFGKKSTLSGLPDEGSFLRYLQGSGIPFKSMDMGSTKEIGTAEALNRAENREHRCRPYNRVTFNGDRVIKEGITQEAKVLIRREIDWYKTVSALGFKGIPRIYSFDPLTMEAVSGDNIFKARLDDAARKTVIDKVYSRLEELHHLREAAPDCFDIQEEYYQKTLRRLRGIRDVIPFADERIITINGVECRNIYFYPEILQEKVDRVKHGGEFGVIHGDCTFTNMLVDADLDIFFIDPRGYFGHSGITGDVYYDWAKVYYSLEGAFDQFNEKNFELDIGEEGVRYRIAPSGWEDLTQYFLDKIPDCDVYRVKLIHAVIWLSLASHCWEDYDSLCTAFYKGLYLLNTFDSSEGSVLCSEQRWFCPH